MFYLITGENTPLIEDEKSKIRANFQDVPFEVIKETTPFEGFIQNTEACDMFSPKKGQILTEPKWLKKTSKETVEKLDNCLKTATTYELPIVFITKKIDKRSATYKLLKKHNVIEKNCPEFKEWESQKVIEWITSYCHQNNCKIDANAAQMLIDAYGSNLGIIKQELNKCMVTILPKTDINSNDLIHASSNAVGEYSQLSNAIKKGNISNIIIHMNSLVKQKEDPHKIFNQLLFQINQLMPIALASQQKMMPETLATKLGKHPFFIKKQMESLAGNSLKLKMPQIMGILAETDKILKLGKLSAKQALINLANKLKYQI